MEEMDAKRIDELVAELSECREDDRNSQSTMVHVISTAGTVLGILFGCSYFISSSEVVNYRYLFHLSGFVFCVALTYIAVLGIGNVLRYYHIQNNDIRGISEDKGKYSRLITEDTTNQRGRIIVSLILAFVKIIAIIAVLFSWEKSIQKPLVGCLVALLIITFLYEFVRKKNKIYLIYLFVGLGYPLRICVGLLAARPNLFNQLFLNKGISINSFVMILVLLAGWAYGILASVLPWVNEVASHIQDHRKINKNSFPSLHRKELHKKIQEQIKDRYEHAESKPINGKVLPLREAGKFSDVWNIAYMLSMSFLSLALLTIGISNRRLIIIEVLILVFTVLCCTYAKRKAIVLLVTIELAVIVVQWYFALMNNLIYFGIHSMQLLFIITYFILRYSPQIEKKPLHEMQLFKKIVVFIIGKYAWKIIFPEEVDGGKL